MKTILTSIAVGGLVAAFATAQPNPRYTVADLGALPGGTFSQATAIELLRKRFGSIGAQFVAPR